MFKTLKDSALTDHASHDDGPAAMTPSMLTPPLLQLCAIRSSRTDHREFQRGRDR
jgi:hypothetical protein